MKLQFTTRFLVLYHFAGVHFNSSKTRFKKLYIIIFLAPDKTGSGKASMTFPRCFKN